MRVAEGIEMLEISANMMGKVEVIHPTLLWDNEAAILVDSGYPGQLPLFREAMQRAGVGVDKLTKIIVTHQDIDHIGSLSAILKECPQRVEVLANAVEKAYIEGEKKLLKITPEAIDQAVAALPAEVPEEWRQAFRSVLENPPTATVDKTVDDGEEIPNFGGIFVIDTPGHTPGHVSLYHKRSMTLIAGDALVVVDGELLAADERYSLDVNLARQSLKKFTHYDIENVICYHGGLYQRNVNKRIAELAE